MRRNIGSNMTRSSIKKAVKSTHTGPGTRVGIKTTGVSQGSLAGLKKSKSAYIQHNEGGYLNPSNQTARYKTRDDLINAIKGAQKSSGGFARPGFGSILDKRLSPRKESSISILNNRSNR